MYLVTCVYLILGILGNYCESASNIQNDARLGLFRQRRQTDCNTDIQFRCKSGECISKEKECDGKADCPDQSDETRQICSGFICFFRLTNSYRCAYGACIPEDGFCNGTAECVDGSDEEPDVCVDQRRPVNPAVRYIPSFFTETSIIGTKQPPVIPPGTCVFPSKIPNGDWTILGDNGTYYYQAGDRVKVGTVLQAQCRDGFTIDQTTSSLFTKERRTFSIFCIDGRWSGSFPRCVPSVLGITPLTPKVGRRPPPIASPGSCVLPSKIQNGEWWIWGKNGTYDYQPGDRVIGGTLLQVQCRKGFKIDGPTPVLFCKDGNWSPDVPQCVKTCQPALIPTSNTFVTCTYNNTQIGCNNAISGTTAMFSCPRFYELSINNPILFCTDGAWEDTKPTCVPVCGEKNVIIKQLVVGGKNVSRGSFPWVVAIYKKDDGVFTHWCGGSLINQRVIVTAAHCVTDQNGDKLSVDLYRVAAGKYFRDFNHPNDTDAEFSEVEKIFIYHRYKALELDYEGDIAVLVTKKSFNSSQFIQRVCIDWNQNSLYESRLLGANGTITGWGYTIRGDKASEILKELEVPYVDYGQCYTAMPREFKKFIRHDKMCAGYLNQGIGVCEGDSGGGLVFQQQEGNRRYFLRGIVSIAPQIDNSCNENEYALYTKISSYIPFIARIERTYRRAA